MEQTIARPRVLVRRPLTALRQVHLAALAGVVVACIYLQAVLVGIVLPPAVMFGVITAGIIAVAATGWRWGPLLGAAWSIFLLAATTDVLVYYIGHPQMPHEFAFHLLLVVLCAIGAVTGIAATKEGAERQAGPRWLALFVASVALLSLGAIVAVLLPRSSIAAGVSPEAVAGLPTLKAGNLAFDQAEIRVGIGETVALRLQNTDTGVHSFDIDELGVHVPIGGGSTSFAYFRPATPGTYTFYCSVPHHGAMRGSLVVEP